MNSRRTGNYSPNRTHSLSTSGSSYRDDIYGSPVGNYQKSNYRYTKPQSIKDKYTLPDEMIHRSKSKPKLSTSPLSSPTIKSPPKSRNAINSPTVQKQKLVVSLDERLRSAGVISTKSPKNKSQHIDPLIKLQKLLNEILSDSDSDDVDNLIESIHAVAEGKAPKQACKYFKDIDVPQNVYTPPKQTNIQKPQQTQPVKPISPPKPKPKPAQKIVVLEDSDDEVKEINLSETVSPIQPATRQVKEEQKSHRSPKYNVGEDLYNTAYPTLSSTSPKQTNSKQRLSSGQRLYALTTGQNIEEADPLDFSMTDLSETRKGADSLDFSTTELSETRKEAINELLDLDSTQGLQSDQEIVNRINKLIGQSVDEPNSAEEEEEEAEYEEEEETHSEAVKSEENPIEVKSSASEKVVEEITHHDEPLQPIPEVNPDKYRFDDDEEYKEDMDNEELLQMADSIIHKVHPDDIAEVKESVEEIEEDEEEEDLGIQMHNGFIVPSVETDDETTGGRLTEKKSEPEDPELDELLQKLKNHHEKTDEPEMNEYFDDLKGDLDKTSPVKKANIEEIVNEQKEVMTRINSINDLINNIDNEFEEEDEEMNNDIPTSKLIHDDVISSLNHYNEISTPSTYNDAEITPSRVDASNRNDHDNISSANNDAKIAPSKVDENISSNKKDDIISTTNTNDHNVIASNTNDVKTPTLSTNEIPKTNETKKENELKVVQETPHEEEKINEVKPVQNEEKPQPIEEKPVKVIKEDQNDEIVEDEDDIVIVKPYKEETEVKKREIADDEPVSEEVTGEIQQIGDEIIHDVNFIDDKNEIIPEIAPINQEDL